MPSKGKKLTKKKGAKGGRLKGVATTSSDGGRLAANRCINDMLPPEILELIFRRLVSPKDLLSCWYTASTWAAALRTTDYYFKMTLGFLMPYLSREDLLTCSLVSKPWNEAIDTCVQCFEDFGSDNRLKPNQRIVLHLNSKNLSQFVDKFILSTNIELEEKYVPANPAAFRRIQVWLSSEFSSSPPSDVWINLLKILDHFGYLIQHLEMCLTRASVCYLEKIKLVKNCMKRTANLRVLQIDAPCPPSENFDMEHVSVKLKLEALSAENTWPVLDHFKVLKYHHETARDGFAIIANVYAPQLLYLKFGHQLMQYIWPNAELYTCLHRIVYVFKENISGIKLAEFVQLSKCRLKHLTMLCEKPDNPEEIQNGLMYAVNTSGDFLETLVIRPIEVGLHFDIVDYDLGMLHLIKLKVLKLESFGYATFEFLRKVCPNLEQLTMRPAFSDYRLWLTPKYFYNLYSKHEFWKRMPATQRVYVEYGIDFVEVRKIYSRRRYEHILETGESISPDKYTSRPTPQFPGSSFKPQANQTRKRRRF